MRRNETTVSSKAAKAVWDAWASKGHRWVMIFDVPDMPNRYQIFGSSHEDEDGNEVDDWTDEDLAEMVANLLDLDIEDDDPFADDPPNRS